jgi:hypothetical protein
MLQINGAIQTAKEKGNSFLTTSQFEITILRKEKLFALLIIEENETILNDYN